MFYGANIWDPTLIISQIVCIQCSCYLALGLLQWVVISPFHHGHLSLHFLFDWRFINVHSFTGWLTVSTWLLNAFLCATLMLLVVGRAKKCLDYSSTLYIWHAIFTMCKSGMPASVVWWVVMLTSLAITSLLGEWLCLQREMRDIPLNSLRDSRKKAPVAVPPIPAGTSASASGSVAMAGSNITGGRAGSAVKGGSIAMSTRTSSAAFARESSHRGGAASRESRALLSGPNAV